MDLPLNLIYVKNLLEYGENRLIKLTRKNSVETVIPYSEVYRIGKSGTAGAISVNGYCTLNTTLDDILSRFPCGWENDWYVIKEADFAFRFSRITMIHYKKDEEVATISYPDGKVEVKIPKEKYDDFCRIWEGRLC